MTLSRHWLFGGLKRGQLGVIGLYLLVDEVNGASRVDVHKVNISVVVDELRTPRHGVGEAALHLWTHTISTKEIFTVSQVQNPVCNSITNRMIQIL